jgi:hypothetical protein
MDLERLYLSIMVFIFIEIIVFFYINSEKIIETILPIIDRITYTIKHILYSIRNTFRYIVKNAALFIKNIKIIIDTYLIKIKCSLFNKKKKCKQINAEPESFQLEPKLYQLDLDPILPRQEVIIVNKSCCYSAVTQLISKEIIEETWNNLPKGRILYNPPSKMIMGIKERVEVRITNKITEDLKKGLKGKGEPILEDIKVSLQMKARLDGGDAFEIKELFDSETMAIIGDYTQWDWDVTPLKSGIQKLLLYVGGIIEIRDLSDRFFCVPVLEREIQVDINYNYKIKKLLTNYWQWIIGTIIALLGLITTYYTA